MFYQEKQAFASLIGTIVISAVYFLLVYQRVEAGIDVSNLFSFWASVILIYIPVAIVFKVILVIVVIIIHTITSKEAPLSISDEFDRLIDLKATRNFYHVFMAGFLLSMGTQVLGMGPSVMFIVLMVTIVVAGLTLDISQLYLGRKGV